MQNPGLILAENVAVTNKIKLLFFTFAMGMPFFGQATTSYPQLVQHKLKSACQELLTSRNNTTENAPLRPGFWFWQDRDLKSELHDYRSLLPREVEVVRPNEYGGDKSLLLAAEYNLSEFGYVFIVLKDGSFKYQQLLGQYGKPALPLDEFTTTIITLLLEIEDLNSVDKILASHTHPHVNFTREAGMRLLPYKFSDADLIGANRLKYIFEANGIFFPLQFEIIYAKISETHDLKDTDLIAKKALLYPARMSTATANVPTFSEREKQIFSSDWDPNKTVHERLRGMIAVGK